MGMNTISWGNAVNGSLVGTMSSRFLPRLLNWINVAAAVAVK